MNTHNKEYWSQYKVDWRRKKRRECKEFTVSYTKDELKVIEQVAKEHGRSPTSYIKASSLAYANATAIPVEPKILNAVREILTMAYTSLQDVLLQKSNTIDEDPALAIMIKTEENIETLLNRHETFEEMLLRLVQDRPERKEQIIEYLKNH